MAKKKETIKSLRITLVRSAIGYTKDQKATVRALGLHKLNSSVVKADTPAIRGMVYKINHLLQVEEVNES
jgi:large subunit ribosomal protein L30